MSEDADYLYALELQTRLNSLNEDSDDDIQEVDFKPPPLSKKPLKIKRSNPRSNLDEDFLNRTQNLVHPQWETLDPTPDVHGLFKNFDDKFFQGRLKCVTLEWSKKMYSCAGICYSKRNRYGMDITIRLSEPLLKLRPRKDLVETMLHEMIHAYCFALNIREGNGGHGPNFKRIMYAINKVAGTNITVYHSFNDEVELYKQHWWRCNGVCQNRSPFFGYVKRTSNRAPSANDQWWAAHKESCGGTFMKIKGPEKTKKEKTTKENRKPSAAGDIRKFLSPSVTKGNTAPSTNSFSNTTGFKGPVKFNGGGSMLWNPQTKSASSTPAKSPLPSIAQAFPPTSYPGISSDPFNAGRALTRPVGSGNLSNVRGLVDLLSDSSESGNSCGNSGHVISTPKSPANRTLSGRGYSLNSGSSASDSSRLSGTSGGDVIRNHLREVWAKRFGGGSKSDSEEGGHFDEPAVSKRRRLSTDEPSSSNGNGSTNKNWVVVDDDVMMQDQPAEFITLSSSDEDDAGDSDEECSDNNVTMKPKSLTGDERLNAIKREILDESNDLKDEDIDLIDDEYNDNDDFSAAAAIADTSIIDEFFGEDTLLKEFNNENDVQPRGSRYMFNETEDIITCPICQGKMKRCVLNEHLDGCMGIAIKVQPPKTALKKLAATATEIKPKLKPRMVRSSTKDLLRKAGYTESDLEKITSDEEEVSPISDVSLSSPELSSSPAVEIVKVDLDSSNEDSRLYRQRNLYKTTRQCPKCAEEVEESAMSWHIGVCSAIGGKRKTPIRKKQKCPKCERDIEEIEMNEHLDDCLTEDEPPDKDSRLYRQRNILKTTRQCPKCAQEIEEDAMNDHLDECL